MNIQVEDEDSLTERFDRPKQQVGHDRYCGYPCADGFPILRILIHLRV